MRARRRNHVSDDIGREPRLEVAVLVKHAAPPRQCVAKFPFLGYAVANAVGVWNGCKMPIRRCDVPMRTAVSSVR